MQQSIVKGEARAKGSLSLMQIVVAVLVVAIAALGYQVYKIKQEVAHAPKVIVIDFMEHVNSYGMDIGEIELEERMERTRTQIRTLKDAGYVILNSDHVVAAPEYLYLPTEIGGNSGE